MEGSDRLTCLPKEKERHVDRPICRASFRDAATNVQPSWEYTRSKVLRGTVPKGSGMSAESRHEVRY